LKFIKRRQEKGKQSPLDYKPDLPLSDVPYWNAWNTLHSLRPVGYGPSAIPLSELLAYAEVYTIEGEDRIEFIEVLLTVDAEWLTWARTKHGDTTSSNRREEGQERGGGVQRSG
jgi:hypothetical protein